MPRFARRLPNNGKEILSMHHVIQYLIKMGKPVIAEDKLEEWLQCDSMVWSNYAGDLKNMIATCPGKVIIVEPNICFILDVFIFCGVHKSINIFRGKKKLLFLLYFTQTAVATSYESNTAPPSKNAVSAFLISSKLLSFTFENS